MPSGGHTCPRPALWCSWVQEPGSCQTSPASPSPFPPMKSLDSEGGASVRRRKERSQGLVSFLTCETRMVNPLPEQ